MLLTVERAKIEAVESQQLMAELWREIDALYGNHEPSTWQLEGMEVPGAAFLIARHRGDLAGCAALRPLSDSIAEAKRVFVRPTWRRSGVARALMHAVEKIARDAAFSELRVETGLRQPAAMALYEGLGYTRIAAFGDYKDDPISVCYGKQLR